MSIKTKFIILLISLAALPLFMKAQGTCSFSIKTQVTPVDCRANGAITITLEGADLGSMKDFLYKAYPTGANPNDYHFISNNVISGLVEGQYTIEVKAFCTLSGVDISQQQVNVTVPRTVAYIEPDFSVNPNLGRKTLNCIPTGVIYLQNIVKGKGPYTIKFVSYPATYTGNPIIVNESSTLASTYQLENLSAGTYEIELSDGCGSTVRRTAVVEALSSDFLSTLVGSTFYSSSAAKDGNCNNIAFYKSMPGSTSDWYYYVRYAALYYEYAVGHVGQDVNSLTWTSFPSSTSSTSYTISTSYSISEMRADSTKRPKVYFRVKGGNCAYYTYSPKTISEATMSQTVTNTGCGVQSNSFGVGSTSSTTTGIMCFPYTWKVVESNTDGTGTPVTHTSTTPRYSGGRDVILMYPGKTYNFTITDAAGYFITDKRTVTEIAPSYSYSSSYTACRDSSYIYLSGVSVRGGKIEFLPASSGANVVPPPHTTINVPSSYTGTVYLYSSDYTKLTYFPVSNIPTGQNAVFRLTDSCGVSRTVTYGGAYTYTYVKSPTLDIDVSCGRAVVKATDLAQIFKNLHTRTGALTAGPAVYMKIISSPTGTTPIYSFTSGYLRSSTAQDYVELSKSGIYTFRVSNSTSFPTSSCYIDFDVNIQIPEMSINEATSAAYRCPGSLVGTGYMNIKVKNGSGNYHFTLYGQNDLNTPLATSTTGVFTSWIATSSDYYVIKVEDLTCGRSMTHSIFVYDLGNATLGWPEDNVFIKCLGDKIRLYALALGETTYTWTGPNGWTSTERNPEIPVTTLSSSGVYTITVEVPGCGSAATVSDQFTLSVADKVMYWNPDAQSSNWHDPKNWLTSDLQEANAVPAPCTTVHIAGNAVKYPNLDMASTPRNQYGFPTCDTIIFHYGAETVYPHYLKYNRARVQYNFNYFQDFVTDTQPTESIDLNEYPNANWGEDMPAIKRAQWATIAAPLKQMTGGDFGLGGFPNFYQRLYNTMDPQRGLASKDSYTLPFNTYNVDLATTGHAMALWVPDYNPNYLGLGDHKQLQALKGVLEMPYFLNPKIMAHRPLDQYNVADSTSLFQYYDEYSPTMKPVDKWDSYKRGYKAFRFVYENNKDSVDLYNVEGEMVAGYKLPLPTYAGLVGRVMIGNPLMCHINFDRIYAVNSDVIEDRYMVTNGTTEAFQTYRSTGDASQNELDNQIAPLQGFVVQLKSSPSRNYLLLPFEGAHSVITPTADGSALPKAKSVNASKNTGWLNIVAATPPKTGVNATSQNVTTRSTLLVNYPMSNIPKLIFPEGLEAKAEVYLIGQDGYANTELVETGTPETVKLGLESLFRDNISLIFSKDNTGIIDRVVLVDKYLNTTKDVTDGGIYQFKHRYNSNNGVDNERFELKLTYKASSISGESDSPLVVYATRNKFVAQSGDILKSVSLYNALGGCLISENDMNTTDFSKDIMLIPGVYLATVTLVESSRVITQKIVVR